MNFNLSTRVVAEFLGTAFLLAAVVGSGIMAERLASGNLAIALLANTLATGAALVALILTFGTISGAHFNPAVTIADALRGGNRLARSATLYCCPGSVLSVEWGRRTSCSGCRCSPCPFTRGVGAPSCGASSSLPSDCSRSFGDALALGPQQSPLPWELISLPRIGSRLRLHLPIPRLHWPGLLATPLPGFVLLTLPASWLRN